VLAAITTLVGAVAVRTVIAVVRDTLLPEAVLPADTVRPTVSSVG